MPISSSRLRNGIVFCMLSLAQYAGAQVTPQYVKVAPPTGTPGFGTVLAYYPAPFEKELPRKLQVIYQPKYISPAAPAGYIKSIYFFTGTSKYMPTTGAVYDVKIKMGYINRDSFKRVNWVYAKYARDTFITGLTTVFSADSLVMDLRSTLRYWLKIPLISPGFYYTGGQDRNLVVELSFGNSPWVKGYFSLVDSATADNLHVLAGYRDSIDVAVHGPSEFMVGTFGGLDFGFDLTPGAAVHEPVISVGDLYPNPVSSVLNIPVRGYKGSASVRISTVEGKTVMEQQYALSGGQATLSLRIKDLPPGTYLVKIGAGEDAVQRKFTKL